MNKIDGLTKQARVLKRIGVVAAIGLSAMFFSYHSWLNAAAPDKKLEHLIVAVQDVDAQECSLDSPLPTLQTARQQHQPVTIATVNKGFKWVALCNTEINQKTSRDLAAKKHTPMASAK